MLLLQSLEASSDIDVCPRLLLSCSSAAGSESAAQAVTVLDVARDASVEVVESRFNSIKAVIWAVSVRGYLAKVGSQLFALSLPCDLKNT